MEVPDKERKGSNINDPDKSIYWKIVSYPVQMNDNLIQCNIKHFGQAHRNAFTIPPILDEFNFDGTGNSVELFM